MKVWVLAAAVALGLAGCGGGSAAKTSNSTSSTTAANSTYGSVQALATAIGCEGFEKSDETTLYALEDGTCTIGEGTVYLSAFTDDTDRDNWLKVAKEAAGGRYAVGEKWVVTGDDQSALTAITNKVGGKLWP